MLATAKKIEFRLRTAVIRTGSTKLINLYFALLGSDARVSCEESHFVVSNGRLSIRIGHIDRMSIFMRGLAYRRDSLAKTYFLDKVTITSKDVVVDCGANIGEIGNFLVDSKCEYHAFEPSELESKLISKNVPGAQVHKYGLWKEECELSFFQASETADSSLIEPVQFDTTTRVQAKRLDQFGFDKIKLLKLEAEGAEPEVLEGATSLLKNIEYISADLGFERGRDAESTFLPVLNFLVARGFVVAEIDFDRLTVLFKNTFGHK